ncbi:MAG: bifunctional 5,10-methylene-tetrahydrofolate dehydrogenase/5,10-methylene-tetrahydrofolate cyclohydrolase [Actinobacteria bacterium]|nr:bifunctional 5,10-methylene-tetrahydrofolate dehydrogenase/5,10-methylene-tetrahydrofolate cyclohydrolase [Actinomycetota bacterium]
MSAKIIDGKAIAAELREELSRELEGLKAAGARPGIATLMVGEDFGAGMYRSAVEKFCGEMGLGYRNESLSADTGEEAVVAAVRSLNEDPGVSGILPLRPFPAHVSDSAVINSISVDKDVDCFHPFNMGRLTLGEPTFPPATPSACIELLERHLRAEGKDVTDALEGAEVCVVGHSNIVGKPLALLFLNRNATTTVAHVYTSNRGNLAKHTSVADILVVAAGVPQLIGPDVVKEGAVILDVGINRVVVCPECGALNRSKKNPCRKCGADLAEAETKTVGDVDYERVSGKASAITPVPGGVGAVTNMMLARNTLRAARAQLEG